MSVSTMIGTPGQSYFVNGNTYTAAGTSGLINGYTPVGSSFVSGIAAGDVVSLLNEGVTYGQQRFRFVNFGVVATANASQTVATVALANGALTIATQPDVPRQIAIVTTPGSALTAGTNTVVYTDETGTSRTEVMTLVMAGTTTQVTTYGVASMTSMTVAALAGGTSPNIRAGTNTTLALPNGATKVNGMTVIMATLDHTTDVLPTAASTTDTNLITPNTAPNGTHTYAFGYTYFE